MLSILIVNWNTREMLQACLTSLEKFASVSPQEIIVVDNASLDGSAEMVRNSFPAVRLIQSNFNLGYAGGNNRAFAEAQGEWLLTLNPDTEVYEDTLDKAIGALETWSDVGSLGARLIGVDGNTQRSVRGFPGILGILGDITGLSKLMPNTRLGGYRLWAFDYDRTGEAPQPMGTFLLFRRSALAAVGDPKHPYDEAFPIFFNEVDLLFRLKKAGWRCLYEPSVRLLHHGGESTKQVRRSMIWESHRSLVRYLRKHHARPWNLPGLWLVAGLIYAGAFVRARGYDAGFRP